MHINVFLQKFLISNDQNFDLFQKWSRQKVEEIARNHIKNVAIQMKQYNSLPKNWQKQISDWENYAQSTNTELPVENKTTDEIIDFITRTSKENKIRTIKYESSKNIQTINKENNENREENNEENYLRKQKIGKIGEEIVWKLLCKKYNIDTIMHMENIDKYAPYDFKILTSDKPLFIEVKSSSKPSLTNWFISRREYEFYKSHKKQYSIIFVRDICIEKDAIAIVEEMKNPNIIIKNDTFGFENGTLIVTPISYKGLY